MRPFAVVDCKQRSPEWVAARTGRVTSSNVSDMLANPRRDGKEAAGPRNLRVRLALERITQRSLESTYVSAAMQRGIEREADALTEYEALAGEVVLKAGFLSHVELMAGASLDGYLGDYDAVVEAKSPEPTMHLEYLTTGKVPVDYYRQMVHQCWLTGASRAVFVAFNPDFPDPLRLKVVELQIDAATRAAHEINLRSFLGEVDQIVKSILALKGAA
jgi:predicted phage-related endonuclease